MNYKMILSSAGAWLWAVVGPAIPHGVVCTAFVVADVVTARRLARRIRRRLAEGDVPDAARLREKLKFNSARLGHALGTLAKTYALLTLAALVEGVVTGPQWGVLKFVSGAVCLWQALSMLENEASCNGARWARAARKVLIDKTERHIGVSLDEIFGGD